MLKNLFIMKIGEKIKALRASKGMSAGRLAMLCGFSSSQIIYNYEKGLSDPPIEKIQKIAAVLGVEVSHFIDGYEEKNQFLIENESNNLLFSSFELLRKQLTEAKEEKDRLWALIEKLTNGKLAANFLNAPDEALCQLRIVA